ncbi:MAG: SRPBCC domain-containing protein [Candidatus Gracilibacteria bacterium]
MTELDLTPKTLHIVRTFNAPIAKVWGAWTDPEQCKKWWGPETYSCPFCEIDLKVGGKYLMAMRSPEGQDAYSGGTYLEIDPLKKLVYEDSFTDEKGNIISAEKYGMKGFPLKMLVTVTFEEDTDGKTKVTLVHEGHPTYMSSDAESGWNSSLDKMEKCLTN